MALKREMLSYLLFHWGVLTCRSSLPLSCSAVWQRKMNCREEGSRSMSRWSSRRRFQTEPGCLPSDFLSGSAGTPFLHRWPPSSWSASPGSPSSLASAAPQQHEEGKELQGAMRMVSLLIYLKDKLFKSSNTLGSHLLRSAQGHWRSCCMFHLRPARRNCTPLHRLARW